MKRKSIPAFVLGLLSGISVLIFGAVAILIFGLVAGLSDKVSEVLENVHAVSTYLIYAGAILSILGSAFCFSKSRVGGVLMIIASALLIFFPIINTILIILTSSTESIFLLILTYIPAVLSIIGAVLAMKGRIIQQIIKEESMNIEA